MLLLDSRLSNEAIKLSIINPLTYRQNLIGDIITRFAKSNISNKEVSFLQFTGEQFP